MSQEKQDNLNLTAEEMKHFDKLESELKKAGVGAGGKDAKLDVGELCKQYKKVRGVLLIALPFIKKIPKFGATIATAIELLMGIADMACPTA